MSTMMDLAAMFGSNDGDGQENPIVITPPERKWSDFQEAIYDFGKEQPKTNLIIQAVAGSGKSTTLFELAKRLGGEIIFLAFNKNIAEYAKGKLSGFPNIDCRTFHSLGLQLIKRQTGFYPDVDQKALKGTTKTMAYLTSLDEFDKKYYRGDFYPKFLVYKVIKHIRQLGMMSYELDDIVKFVQETPGIFSIEISKRAAEEYWFAQNYMSFPGWLKVLDMFPDRPKDKSGVKINTWRTVIDFDDMVRLPAMHNLVTQFGIKQKKALIDESQDMNPYQINLVEQLYKRGIRTICCGDRRQAIYAFRGAFMDSMDRMKDTTSAEELPLSVTYRSRKAIVDFVNENIPDSNIIAFKDGGEVRSILKQEFNDVVKETDARMIVGARNKCLIECWIHLAKAKIPSTLKGSNIVKEIRDMVKDINPQDLPDLLARLSICLEDAIEINDDGTATCKRPMTEMDLMAAIPELTECFELQTLGDLENILREMEKDAFRELHTVHSAKGLESEVVVVLCDWFNSNQLVNMQYVAYTRAADTLILVEDWYKEKSQGLL